MVGPKIICLWLLDIWESVASVNLPTCSPPILNQGVSDLKNHHYRDAEAHTTLMYLTLLEFRISFHSDCVTTTRSSLFALPLFLTQTKEAKRSLS